MHLKNSPRLPKNLTTFFFFFCRTNLKNFLTFSCISLFYCPFSNHLYSLLFQQSPTVGCFQFLIYRICLLAEKSMLLNVFLILSFQLMMSCCCWVDGGSLWSCLPADTLTVNGIELHCIFRVRCLSAPSEADGKKTALTIFCSHHTASSGPVLLSLHWQLMFNSLSSKFSYITDF